MANTFELTILTPEKEFLSGPVEQVIFDTPKGRLGLMAEHMAMVASVIEGILEIQTNGRWQTAAVGQGFAEIGSNKVNFFVDSVEWAEDVDTVRAKQALERAELRLRGNLSHIEFMRTQAAISRAMARLKAAKRSDSK